jgi:cytidylate kinase
MIVAIDGPAGAGKSTIATQVAKRLGLQLIDTGAMYRVVAYLATIAGIPLEDENRLAELASDLDFSFEFVGDENRAFCNGKPLGTEIRSEEVGKAASMVSQHPAVRSTLVALQRKMGKAQGSVLEGRDIGTVVFPDADVKVFLTASSDERARRRVEQLRERGEEADPAQILADIRERDERDTTRATAPLIPADDAVKIDSTANSIDDVVASIVALAAH